MDTCTPKAKNSGIAFTIGLRSGSTNVNTLLTTLNSALSVNLFEPVLLSHIIDASMRINPDRSVLIGLSQLTTVEDVAAYVEANKLLDPNVLAKNIGLLQSIPGYESVDNTAATLRKLNDKELVTVPTQLDSYISNVVTTDGPGLLVKAEEATAVAALEVGDGATAMLKKRIERVKLNKEIKEKSADFWKPFLSVYFPGMTSAGAEFVEWTKNKFYGALIDNTISKGGFISSINDAVNKVKAEVENNVLSARKTVAYPSAVLTIADLNSDDAVKFRYFNEVLTTDFDFILHNMIKSVTVSPRATADANYKVRGFVDVIGEPIKPTVLNTSRIADLFITIAGEKNMFELKATDDKGRLRSNILNQVDLDAVSIKEDSNLAKDSFYYTTIDEKYFYKNAAGELIDLSPISHYSYNSSNKHNKDSIDHFVGAFDSDTSFIQNLFQMFRRVSVDENGGLVFGDRMNIIDFLTVAPHLTEAGNSLEEFVHSLTTLAGKDSPAGRVARSLNAHIFSTEPTIMADGSEIYSIAQAMKNDGNSKTTANELIIKTLHGALISKDHTRYLKTEEDKTSVTRGLETVTESDTVNTALAGILMRDQFTKKSIADALIVSPDQKSVVVKISTGVDPIDPNLISVAPEANRIPMAEKVAMAMGLTREFNAILTKFREVYTLPVADKGAIDTLKNIVYIAAVNKKTAPMKPAKAEVNKIFENDLYAKMPPSTVISGDNLKVMGLLYNVDSHKSVRVGGSMTATTSTPNRDSSLGRNINRYNKYNKVVNPVKFLSNPFLDNHVTEIPHAKYGGVVLKTAAIVRGEAINLSDWNEKLRIEHAMIQGILKAPKNVGQEFFLQPVNYSDKSNIQMMQVFTEDNLLSDTPEMREKLIDAFIAYQANKNEEMQKIMIHSMKEFVVSNYTSLYNEIAAEEGSEERLIALKSLRSLLMVDYTAVHGDITRPINNLLKIVKIHPDRISFSDANLDKGADIVSFPNNKGTALLKPHLGIRAEVFRNPVRAREEVKRLLREHKEHLASKNIDYGLIDKEMSRVKTDLVSDRDEFFDRFFLISGVYGHALKVMTVADESYFPAKYAKGTSIDDYYTAIDEGARTGLEEVGQMIVAQNKRAQSILTRGNLYSQKETVVGMKREFAKNNIISHLDIYGDYAMTLSGTKLTINPSTNEFRFDSLEGKTLSELEGLGILTRFSPDPVTGVAQLTADNGDGLLVNVNVGADNVTFGLSDDTPFELKKLGLDSALVSGILKLLKSSATITQSNPADIALGTISHLPAVKDTLVHHPTERANALTLDTYLTSVKKIVNNTMLVLPDLVPSMTVTDPVTNVNILNAMGVEQENSDGVQYMHILLSYIYKGARGGELGAFNTENHDVMKFLTTTFEFDKARQILQKKAVHMPFTKEQMKKLGCTELYNTFRTMNTAIAFKQPVMNYTETVKSKFGTRQETATVTANNLQELYEYVVKKLGGYSVATDDAAWGKVAEILRQNPVNLYSFVGYLTLPSSQKTGNKKLNKFSDVFNKTTTVAKPHIDYTASEFSYEVLSKAHSYDVSGASHEASTLTLLSQLVNATSFGGLSNVTTRNLQNAMASKMMLNRERVGQDLAVIARKQQEEAEEEGAYTRIIERLSKGDVSTIGFVPEEMDAYNKVLRAGVYDMANLAFQKNDTILIQKIIKGEKGKLDENGKMILEDGNAYSLDSPAVRSKVLGTLRSAFFQDTVKMKMAGFMGAVAATHKVINIYSLPGDVRVGRQGFITAALTRGLPEEHPGKVVQISNENINEARTHILPLDDVLVQPIGKDSKLGVGVVKAFGDLDLDTEILNPKVRVTGVYTPDTFQDVKLDADSYTALDDNTQIKVGDDSYFKWYLSETKSSDEIQALLDAGELSEDAAEKYSLRWYQYSRVSDGVDLKSTAAYRQLYRAFMQKTISTDELNEKRALLIIETQRKEADGSSVWKVTPPEVVLPTYMAAAFGLKKGVTLNDIIGTDGNRRLNAQKFFSKDATINDRYITLNEGQVHYLEMVRRIYASKLVYEKNTFDQEVYNYLSKLNAPDDKLTPADVKHINGIINSARVSEMQKSALAKADAFVEMLEVALTRVPGQSKQSGFMGNVIELFDGQGNAAFAPTEHMVTTGGDFDIDTLSVLTKSIDSNGIIHGFEEFKDSEKGFKKEAILNEYKNEILVTLDALQKRIDAYNREGQIYIEKREAKLAEYVGAKDAFDAGNVAVGTFDAVKNAKDIHGAQTQLEHAKKLIIQDEEILKLKNKTRRKIHGKYENIISNAVADGVFRALDNVDTAVELNTPMSLSLFKPIIEKLEAHNQKLVRQSKLPKVDNISFSWNDLKALPVETNSGINVMRTSADAMHYGNPFDVVTDGDKKLIFAGPNLLTKEDALLKKNAKKLVENKEHAIALYKEWLATNKAVSSLNSDISLKDVDPERRAWIRSKISDGSLTGRTLLYMNNNKATDTITYADILADLVADQPGRIISGEDYTAIFEYENLAAQGRESIGMFATVLKMNSAIQTAKIFYDTNYSGEDRDSYDNPFFFKNEVQFTDYETGVLETKIRTGFADLDRFNIFTNVAKDTPLQDVIANLITIDKSKGHLKSSMAKLSSLVNIMTAEVSKHVENAEQTGAAEHVRNLADSLFGIKLPADIDTAVNPLEFFESYIKSRPELVSKAFSTVIGSQLSNDVESQFLTAATDNAKELILGKIKSSQLTNPLISTMLLLGYDMNVIIKFLYDPNVARVLEYYGAKVDKMERIRLSTRDLKEGGFSEQDESIASLVKLLDIGDEVSKFRALRSLNENTQIEQFKLDKILEGIDSDRLYKAIMANDMQGDLSMLVSESEAQDVFNPSAMIFLHPQSRSLFINLYESEKYKVNALFNTTGNVRDMATSKSRNMNAYRNINTFLSDLQVESYLNKAVEFERKDGSKGQLYRTGVVAERDADGKYTKKNVTLNLPQNRAEFVRGFGDYLDSAKDRIKELTGGSNVALDNIGIGKTHKSSNPVYFVPKIKNSNLDSIEASLIQEGINDLKVKTGNVELDKLNKEIYNNLSLYSLIVSSGEIKKGSMIELFEEINLGLAEHIKSLQYSDYNKLIPVKEFVKDIVKGEVSSLEVIIDKANKKAAKSGFEDMDQGENMDLFQEEEPREMEDPDDSSRYQDNQSWKHQPVYIKAFKGTHKNLDTVFNLSEYNMRKELFYAYKYGATAYRIFPAATPEALPTTTLPTDINFKKVAPGVQEQFARIGMQIGFDAQYKGQPIRILGFDGLQGKNKTEMYLIAHPNGEATVAGVHLMQENPDLFLYGNLIQKVNGFNLAQSENRRKLLESKKLFVPDLPQFVNETIHVGISDLFTPEEIYGDPIISLEGRVLGRGAYDVILPSNNNHIAGSNPVMMKYSTHPDKVNRANLGSRNTLIPAVQTEVRVNGNAGFYSKHELINEITAKAVAIINQLKEGETVTFYGIKKSPNMNVASKDVIVGGTDILDSIFRNSIIKRKDGKLSVLNGAFILERTVDENGVVKDELTRNSPRVGKTPGTQADSGYVMVDGTRTLLDTVVDKQTGRVSAANGFVSDQVKMRALEDGILIAPFKTTSVHLYDDSNVSRKYDVISLVTESGPEVYIKYFLDGFNDKYLKVKNTSDKGVIFDTKNNVAKITDKDYKAILSMLEDPKLTQTNNNNCS